MSDESAADDGAVIDAWQGGLTDTQVQAAVAEVEHLAEIVAAHRLHHPGTPFPILAVLLAQHIAAGPPRWGHLPLVREVLA